MRTQDPSGQLALVPCTFECGGQTWPKTTSTYTKLRTEKIIRGTLPSYATRHEETFPRWKTKKKRLSAARFARPIIIQLLLCWCLHPSTSTKNARPHVLGRYTNKDETWHNKSPCTKYYAKYDQTREGKSSRRSSSNRSSSTDRQQHQQQTPDPRGSQPLLTDPPPQMGLLPETAQLGCLPGTETAQLARSSGQSCRLDPWV